MNVHRGVRLVGLSRRFKQLNVLQTSCHHTQVTSYNSKDDILAKLPNEFATSLNLSSDSKRYMIANNTEFYRDSSYFFFYQVKSIFHFIGARKRSLAHSINVGSNFELCQTKSGNQ